MAIVFPHEGFHFSKDVLLGVFERLSDFALELKRENLGRAAVDILHFGARSQKKVVAFFEIAAFRIAQDFRLDEFRRTGDAVFELRYPEEALVVAQAAGTILHVRFLHENRASIFHAKLGLVGYPPRDVGFA